MGFFSDLFGGGDDEEGSGYQAPPLPEYYLNPRYDEAQDILSNIGTNIMAGNVPSYFRGIGEYGGSEFENLMSLIERDTVKAVGEDIAKRNVTRGGVGTTAVARAVADARGKLGYTDYLKGIEGKRYLFTAGLGTLGDVASSALDESNLKNQFNLNTYGLGLKGDALEEETAAADNSLWAQIFGSAANLGTQYLLNQSTKTSTSTARV